MTLTRQDSSPTRSERRADGRHVVIGTFIEGIGSGHWRDPFADPTAAAALQAMVEKMGNGGFLASEDGDMRLMMASFPVGRMGSFGVGEAELEEFLSRANQR